MIRLPDLRRSMTATEQSRRGHNAHLVDTVPLTVGRPGTSATRTLVDAVPRRWWYRDPVLWVVVAAALAAYSVLSIVAYYTDHADATDLAIFVEAVRGYAYGGAPIVPLKGPGFHLLGDHWHPILVVLGPFFRLWPSPVTLLAAQAILTAASVVPVYRAGVELLGVGRARVVAGCYATCWGVVSMVAFDFHEVAFAVPLVAAATSALARRLPVAAVLWALPLVTVKETLGFTVAALGIVLAVAYRRRLLGALTAVWGLGWSLLSIFVLIPAFNPDGVYPYWDAGSFTSIVGASGKLELLVFIVLPVAGVALRSPLALIAVPELGLRMLATDELRWGGGYHYTAVTAAILFVAAADGLARLQGRRRVGAWLRHHAIAVMVTAAAVVALGSPISTVLQPATYDYDAHDRALQSAVRVVPDGAEVEASVSALPALATRTDAVYWNDGPAPEWIVFDEQSFEWDVTIDVIRDRRGPEYVTVFHRHDVWVLRRADN